VRGHENVIYGFSYRLNVGNNLPANRGEAPLLGSQVAMRWASHGLPLRNQPDFDLAPYGLGIFLQRGERRRMLASRFET